MSAVEALAEVLRQYAPPLPGHEGHCAQIIVNAIRSMPAEQVAELLGGHTIRKGFPDSTLHRYAVVGPWGEPR